MRETSEFQKLNAAYRQAWTIFTSQVNCWRSREPENFAEPEPPRALQEAEVLYRKARNELANYLLSNRSKPCPQGGEFVPADETFGVAVASVATGRRPGFLGA